MHQQLLGIHHLTALASDPQRNVDFYVDVLGLRFVKKTVNFDAPDVYHLYYADAAGTPGTVLTFFPFPNAARGRRGAGEVSRISFTAPPSSSDFWIHRLSKKGVDFNGPETRGSHEVLSFRDPDGLLLDLVFSASVFPVQQWTKGPVPAEHGLCGFHGFTMNVLHPERSAEFLTRVLGAEPVGSNRHAWTYSVGPRPTGAVVELVKAQSDTPARLSAGSIHHVAWRVRDDVTHEGWRSRIAEAGYPVTDVVDRQYFHSIYFREPGGVLFEIATDNPGFTVDEPYETLGQKLQLPPWYEERRAVLEERLIPVFDPSVVVASPEP